VVALALALAVAAMPAAIMVPVSLVLVSFHVMVPMTDRSDDTAGATQQPEC